MGSPVHRDRSRQPMGGRQFFNLQPSQDRLPKWKLKFFKRLINCGVPMVCPPSDSIRGSPKLPEGLVSRWPITNFYSHTGLRGDSPRQRVEAAGMRAYLVGENLMMCPCTRGSRHPVTTSVRTWMRSAGHRRNILLSEMRETGVGIWRRGRTYFLTQLFIEPK